MWSALDFLDPGQKSHSVVGTETGLGTACQRAPLVSKLAKSRNEIDIGRVILQTLMETDELESP